MYYMIFNRQFQIIYQAKTMKSFMIDDVLTRNPEKMRRHDQQHKQLMNLLDKDYHDDFKRRAIKDSNTPATTKGSKRNYTQTGGKFVNYSNDG